MRTITATVTVPPRATTIVTHTGGLGPPGPPGEPGATGPPGPTGPAGVDGGVSSVDGRTGSVTLADRYVDTAGDTMTGPLAVPSLAAGTNPAATGAIRLGNNQFLTARNGAGDADVAIASVSGSNVVIVGPPTGTVRFPAFDVNSTEIFMADGKNLRFQGTLGCRIGTSAAQKLAFYGATPIVRPTGTPAAAVDPATVMALVNDLRAKLIALGLIA